MAAMCHLRALVVAPDRLLSHFGLYQHFEEINYLDLMIKFIDYNIYFNYVLLLK